MGYNFYCHESKIYGDICMYFVELLKLEDSPRDKEPYLKLLFPTAYMSKVVFKIGFNLLIVFTKIIQPNWTNLFFQNFVFERKNY